MPPTAPLQAGKKPPTRTQGPAQPHAPANRYNVYYRSDQQPENCYVGNAAKRALKRKSKQPNQPPRMSTTSASPSSRRHADGKQGGGTRTAMVVV